MAAYLPTPLSWSATALAGQVHSAKTARSLLSAAPSPSLLSFTSTHRPNKAELEARLAGAHVRAGIRRLRNALGHERKGPSAAPAAPRTTRAAAYSLQNGDASIIYSTPAPSYPASPLSRFTYTGATIPSAPSPSMLPPPPTTPRPLFPQRRSRAVVHTTVVGLGLGFAPLGVLEADAPLSPFHVYPATLRRTPGAPLRAAEAEDVPASYFHLPADIITPQLPAVGLGIMNVDL